MVGRFVGGQNMMMLLLLIVMTPLSATTAGILIWVGHRDESLDDGALVRNFVVAMTVVFALLWGISRTESVHKRLDPQYRIDTEIEANPVYSTAKRLDPDTAKVLQPFLIGQMSAGVPISQALLLARPRLTSAVTERLGFADHETRIMWGRLTAESLRELRSANPDWCYAAMAGQLQDPEALTAAFSADNSASFQQAVVQVYEAANKGMAHDPRRVVQHVSFNEAALEFRAIQAEIEQRFDSTVATQVAAKRFPAEPPGSTKQLCSARIFQLEEMLQRPAPMASMLIDSILR